VRAIGLVLVGAGLGAVWWLTGVSSERHLAANLVASYLALWTAVFLVAPISRQELTAGLVLCSMALGALVAGLEGLGLMGVVDYRAAFGTPIPELWLRPYNQPHPTLLFTHKPYARIAGRQPGNITTVWCLPAINAGYRFDIRYDSNGFRNPDGLSRADVAIIGDSYIEAMAMPDEQMLTAVLARLTGATVANLGMSGYGPQQQLEVLQRYAVPLRPRVVVWAFFEGNDLDDALRYEEQRAALAARQPAPSRASRSFIKNSLLAATRVLNPCEPQPWVAARTGNFRAPTGRIVPLYFHEPGRALEPAQVSRALEALGTVFARAGDLSHQHGIRLVVLFVPITLRVYQDLVEMPPGSRLADRWVSDLPARVERLLREAAPRAAYLDLTGDLARAAARGEFPFLPDDTHWSVAGHQLVAEAIQRVIAPDLAPSASR
jgi:hypothetical protein